VGTSIFWLVVACLLGLGELHTGGFFLAPFALGALAAAILSLVGLSLLAGVAVFLGGSLLTLGALRPLARRHRRLPPAIRTGTAALVGRTGVVLERIANREGLGCVKIDGEVWTARSFDQDEVIDTGEQVEVVAIRGATALVIR
jgi:membrane protein implicated in regulation of membrane protease activity